MKNIELERLKSTIESGTACTVECMRSLPFVNRISENLLKTVIIVKLSDGNEYAVKRLEMNDSEFNEFRQICSMELSGLQRIPYIIRCGKTDCIILCQWVNGKTFEDLLLDHNESHDRDLIKTAATLLRKMHESTLSRTRVAVTADGLHKLLDSVSLSQRTKQILSDYLNKQLPVINSRFKSVAHGDVHVGNILLCDNGTITYIDLDDISYGDPYSDLVYASNIIFDNRLNGFYYLFIQEYFEGEIPKDFWLIVNFYSIVKTIVIMRQEIQSNNGKPLISPERLIDEHNGMTCDEPVWFKLMREGLGGKT